MSNSNTMSFSSNSGKLMLIAMGSLVFASNMIHASNVQAIANLQIPESESVGIAANGTAAVSPTKAVVIDNTATDKRNRSGRSYNQNAEYSSSASLANQQQQMESYAAAYAAVNSAPINPDHVTISQTSEPSAYTSFGESPPTTSSGGSSSSSSSAARLLTSTAEYSPQSTSFYGGYMSPSSSDASYASGSQHHNHHQNSYGANPSSNYHYAKSQQQPVGLPLGYPATTTSAHHDYASGFSDRYAPHHQVGSSPPFWSSASSGPTGLMSSASHILSHWTHGFSIGEIICGLVALSISAIILGAPFFLIYLVLMGNFSGSGTLSLTPPTQALGSTTASGSTTVNNGRRKRLAVFEPTMNDSDELYKSADYMTAANSIVNHIRPYVNLQQVSSSFKQLIKSIEQYAHESDSSSRSKFKSS